MIIKLLLWTNISLFILHEMDAVQTREWKMMIFISKLSGTAGHIIFTSLHFFLFIIIFYLMETRFNILFTAVSVLLIIHQFMHIVFRNHSENRMNNLFSEIIIFLMFINSAAGLVYYAVFF